LTGGGFLLGAYSCFLSLLLGHLSLLFCFTGTLFRFVGTLFRFVGALNSNFGLFLG
jgi:hypothetical protein